MTKYMYGRVVSKSSDKTVSILVRREYTHPIYKKIVRRNKKFLIHDPNNQCSVGEYIKVKSCAPISKRKSWCFTGDRV